MDGDAGIGQGEREDVHARSGRKVFLFIHGFLDSGEVWRRVRDDLSRQGFATATLDLSGHGSRAGEIGELSLDAFARDVLKVIDHLDRDVILVGQSMGAQVAELAAVRRPQRVSALALLAPVPLGGVEAPEDVVAPFKALGGAVEQQIQQRQALSHAIAQEDLDWLGIIGSVIRPEVVPQVVDAWNRGHAAGTRKSAFTGPTLVIRGLSDPFVVETMIEGIVSRFENGRRLDVADAGHWPHVEQPKRIADALTELASGLSGEAADAVGDWKGAFANRSASSFADALADDVVLEASVLVKPVRGREFVKRVMETASQVYASLTFTDSAAAGRKQYVEWEARSHEGVVFGGVTVITRNSEGRIGHVAIHHRPMAAALFFSRIMAERLGDAIPPGHFFDASADKQVQEVA